MNKLLRVLRRRFLLTFNREYIARSLDHRKGKCNNCGKCCALAKPDCVYLSKPNICRIYLSHRWRIICNTPDYPIDEADKIKGTEDYCGYYWEKKGIEKGGMCGCA